MKKAWITLLSTEDYLDAVLALSVSLKKVKSKYPLVVGLTKNLYREDIVDTLHEFGIWIELIDTYKYSNYVQEKYKDGSVLNTASKILLFTRDAWDKLIYIDADCYIRENMDELMNRHDGAILYSDEEVPHYGFTSLFVFKPENHFSDFYLEILNKMDSFDGDFLGRMWFYVKDNPDYQIPYDYNRFFYDLKDKTSLGNEKSVHFISDPKPWREVPEELAENPYIKEYLTILSEVEEIKKNVGKEDIDIDI